MNGTNYNKQIKLKQQYKNVEGFLLESAKTAITTKGEKNG